MDERIHMDFTTIVNTQIFHTSTNVIWSDNIKRNFNWRLSLLTHSNFAIFLKLLSQGIGVSSTYSKEKTFPTLQKWKMYYQINQMINGFSYLILKNIYVCAR
jgi:hypothetical protein